MSFPQSIACPAKINWTLKVGPKKPTGFHGVETLMLALALQDTLSLRLDPERPKGEMGLMIQGPGNSPDIPTDGRNLILRAANKVAQSHRQALQELPCGLKFELEKHVPSQAGLGGGSSNAAAAAILLMRGLDAHVPEEDLLNMLAELGSDCPFFGHVLSSSEGSAEPVNSALGHDQGQRILAQLETAPPLWISVVTPEVGCPTGAIYGVMTAMHGNLPSVPAPLPWRIATTARCNDLEGPALTAVPGLLPWRRALSGFDASAFQLSGSGASFYGVAPETCDPVAWHAELLSELTSVGLKPRFQWVGPLFGS